MLGDVTTIGDVVAKLWDVVSTLGDMEAIGDVVAKIWDGVSIYVSNWRCSG